MLRRRKFIVVIPVLLALLVASYFLYIEEQGNFYAITPGEAYRSGQLDRDELEYYIGRYHINSILNLRGSNPDAQWYIEEVKVSKELNVRHYDISLSATSEPGDKDVQRLMEVFKSAPRPILIHCKGGADRSGLVAAMWKVIVDGESKSVAESQLSILYGHIPVAGTIAMDRFFEKWVPEHN
ncbi:hypothetical protein BMS3Abin07_02162 [bacterium BMS3Abin07]|nr:hypothetical protein BMS3Abin07_02162 [bacterium BMS3Abin07]HDL21066.1 protein tyrosine phosphatase [Nitrospirota bacterium]HDO22832.1 protein tyrosine phosphatase [Nitrospirota bacterium]HDZ88635.1 protein tyrosine phosphatase [Nitrospirota bacterium]